MDTATGPSPGTQPDRGIRLQAELDPDLHDPVLPLLHRVAALLCDFLDLVGPRTRRHGFDATAMAPRQPGPCRYCKAPR